MGKLVFFLFLTAPGFVQAKKAKPAATLKGAELLKAGWREIARCDDGHQWSYILEKGKERRFCRGINAYAGPLEEPCGPYSGNLAEFQALSARAKDGVEAYDNAGKAGRLDQHLEEKRRQNGFVNCWDGKVSP